MGGKIPPSIRRQVIGQWLDGNSRDQIAKDNNIGTGTVSSIIKECRENDPDFNLLREIAFTLKREDLNVAEFAPTVRLRKKLEQEIGLGEEQIEAFIVNLNMHYFKRGVKEQEFLGMIDYVISLSNKLGIPVDQLSSYITLKKKESDELNKEVENIRYQRYKELVALGISQSDLEEYKRNRPLFEQYKKLEEKLLEVQKQTDSYKKGIEHERLWKSVGERQRWSIPKLELDKVKIELRSSGSNSPEMIRTLGPRKLEEMAMDIFYHPSSYVKAIGQMMDIYNLLHKEKEQ